MKTANSLLYINDQPGHYPHSYLAASRYAVEELAPLTGQQHSEVGIVGAGYTGLSTAIHLRKLGYEVSLVEAQRIGFGASGRNGGQVGLGQRQDQFTLEKVCGHVAAQLFWELSLESKKLVKSLAQEMLSAHQIDCDLQSGIVYADHKARFSSDSQSYVKHLQNHYHYQDIAFWDRQQTAAALGSERYYSGIYDARSLHLHPLNFCLGLAKIALQLGVKIYENSEVLQVSDDNSSLCLKSEQGQLSCDKLLYAGNGYLGKLAPLPVKQHVMPINNYIVATEPLPDALYQQILVNNIAAADSKFVVNYFRKSADNRLLFGGRESYSYRFHHDIKNYVRSAMLSVYPQLKDVRLDYGWGGTLAITMGRMPYFKQLSDRQFSVSGYSGHGVGAAVLAGKIMAAKMHDARANHKAYNTFANYPNPIFPGHGRLQNAWLVLGMLYYSLRDRL